MILCNLPTISIVKLIIDMIGILLHIISFDLLVSITYIMFLVVV